MMVPKVQQEVTVIGEVQTATSHLYRKELGRDDYINLSGGLTRRADEKHIYVVRADGSVVANEGGRWFNRGGVEIRPGDTVVVPLDTERLAGAAVLAGRHADHLQPRDLGGGGQPVLIPSDARRLRFRAAALGQQVTFQNSELG